MTHHVISVDDLSSLGHNSFGISLLLVLATHHCLHVWGNTNVLILWLAFFPVNLKFGYSWLLNQDVAVQLWNIRHIWGVFDQVWEFLRVSVVHIVSHSEKLLGSIVGAGHQNSCDSHNISLRQFSNIGELTLQFKIRFKLNYLPRAWTSSFLRPRSPFLLPPKSDHIGHCLLVQYKQFSKWVNASNSLLIQNKYRKLWEPRMGFSIASQSRSVHLPETSCIISKIYYKLED